MNKTLLLLSLVALSSCGQFNYHIVYSEHEDSILVVQFDRYMGDTIRYKAEFEGFEKLKYNDTDFIVFTSEEELHFKAYDIAWWGIDY